MLSSAPVLVDFSDLVWLFHAVAKVSLQSGRLFRSRSRQPRTPIRPVKSGDGLSGQCYCSRLRMVAAICAALSPN
jgi:hypothetical protein